MPRIIQKYLAVLWVVLLALLCLPGCGDGSTAPSSGETWRYVALGDSLAVGFTAQRGYVERYSEFIQTDNQVNVSLQNLGRSGWQSGDLLNALRNDSNFRDAVASADVLTWDIGGNDLLHAYRLFVAGNCGGGDNQDCFRSAVANFTTNWNGIIGEIRSTAIRERVILRTMDIYNPFVGELIFRGDLERIGPYLDQVNDHIRTSCEENGIPMARVFLAFNGESGDEDPVAKGLIAIDRFHANDAGHKLMADLLRDLGYAPRR